MRAITPRIGINLSILTLFLLSTSCDHISKGEANKQAAGANDNQEEATVNSEDAIADQANEIDPKKILSDKADAVFKEHLNGSIHIDRDATFIKITWTEISYGNQERNYYEPVIYQFKEPRFHHSEYDLSKIDELNGLKWKSIYSVECDALRSKEVGGGWSKWRTPEYNESLRYRVELSNNSWLVTAEDDFIIICKPKEAYFVENLADNDQKKELLIASSWIYFESGNFATQTGKYGRCRFQFNKDGTMKIFIDSPYEDKIGNDGTWDLTNDSLSINYTRPGYVTRNAGGQAQVIEDRHYSEKFTITSLTLTKCELTNQNDEDTYFLKRLKLRRNLQDTGFLDDLPVKMSH